ncbi:TIGR00366 family protein [Sinomicrobium kalidii]|uniref:short-chain fatty acid transporter n=1 Tax=Sinomicrobium kalidii TaxID=2900738 RepID=UPI001E56F61F|nr:TIGR00366 family protein [Sinomicrobium kalidii]UGU14282.1 TIGR00366 family protein [Sinomicrobium kalidii]
MNPARVVERIFKKFLPSQFTIAVLLTLLTVVLAYFFSGMEQEGRLVTILSYWEKGVWDSGLLVFAYQMMLILVLGHVLVLSPPVSKQITMLTRYATNTASAAVLVSVTTMLAAFFNWGLALIFGAVLARKVGEKAVKEKIPLNYPLVGAAGYTGLMVWHGGMSGSAPLKVAEKGHIADLMKNVPQAEAGISSLPEFISTQHTIFSWWNLLLFALLLIVVPIVLYAVGKKVKPTEINLKIFQPRSVGEKKVSGAERMDRSRILALVFSGMILVAFFIRYGSDLTGFNITPNMLNLFMFGLAILLHHNFRNFLEALEEAVKGVSGILIQFPLYFGIMGIMGQSGMVEDISGFFVAVANATTLPVFTFFSGGLVNIFVPSGGGQWAVQGPVVLDSALKLGVPLPKAVMALAYGDQITNMLQPFWALPLLGITRLRAKDILPYTLLLMLVGTIILITGLLLL